MKTIRLAAAAGALAAACSPAFSEGALLSYGISDGTGTFTWASPRGCAPAPGCPPEYEMGWGGTLVVQLDSSSDGTFTGWDVMSMTFTSNFGSWQVGGNSGAVVTVSGGQVDSIDFAVTNPSTTIDNWESGFQPAAITWSMSGGTMSEIGYGTVTGDSWSMVGGITPVPEPAPAALLALGALVVGSRRLKLGPGQP